MTLDDLRTITVTEASERLNISPDRVRRLVRAGQVRYFQEGANGNGTYRIVESDLVAAISANLKGSSPTTAAPVPEKATPLRQRPRGDIEDLLPPKHRRAFA